MTIRKQLLYTIILITLIPMLIIPWMGYIYIKNVVKDQLLFQSRNQLEEITRDTEDMLQDILMVSNVIAADETVNAIIRNEQENIKDLAQMIQLLSEINAIYLYQYNAEICVYDNYGHVYSTLRDEKSENEDFREEWREETIKNKAFFLWKSFPGLSEEGPVLGMSRNLYDQNGKKTGVLCIEINNDRNLKQLLEQKSDMKNTERYLVGEDGKFVLSYAKDETAGYFSEEMYRERMSAGEHENWVDEDFVYFQESVNKTDWKIIQIVPYDEVFGKLNSYRKWTYASNIICLILLIIIDSYLTNRISRSLICLGNAMKQVRNGHFVTVENKEKNVEMRKIYDDFNNMSTRLKWLFEENRRITKEKEEYRLTALQTQIQPHFLFNTLNGIKWLCIIESAPTAERMLESLGHILEYSLGKAKECVPLGEEITCLRHYVELQKMRYGNIFDVIYEIDEAVKNLEVPVLLLQPLVENSIIHGIREKKDRGMIVVTARIENGMYVLSVEDNGMGISCEKLEKIMNSEHPEGSIGIVNVKERIKFYYKESRFEINSEVNKGTKISMILGGSNKDENSCCG